MKNKPLLILVLIALVVGGGLLFLSDDGKDDDNDNDPVLPQYSQTTRYEEDTNLTEDLFVLAVVAGVV